MPPAWTEQRGALFTRNWARRVSGGKGEGGTCLVTLTLPALRASLPLPLGEGL